MEKRRRLGRGLEDISHYFISQDQTGGPSAALIGDSEDRGQVISIVDLFDPHRGALFVSRIGVGLCKNGIRTLAIDTDARFPGIAFMLGLSVPGYSFRHYLQDQYQISYMIYTGPFGLKLLAPRLRMKDLCSMKRSDVSLMLHALLSVEKEIDIIIQRHFEGRVQPLIKEAIFIIPAFHTGMIRAYREIKSFIGGVERKGIGIIITDAADEPAAMKAYKRIYYSIEKYCGVRPYFGGYLSDMATFSMDKIVSRISEGVLNSKGRAKGGRPFFETLRYTIGLDNLTDEEVSNLLC